MVHHQIKVVQALASAITEGGRGANGTAFPNQPEKALKLYEFEGSPFCRRVREVMTLLNLDYEVYPCPKGGTKYRKIVKELGGKAQFPFFVDENTGENCMNHKILSNICLKITVNQEKHQKNIHIIQNFHWLHLQVL